MKIDKNKLLDNFKNLKNIVNIKLLKCFKVLFTKIGLSTNIGFYIFISLIIFHTIVLILFYHKKLYLLIDKIKSLMNAIKILKAKKGEKKEEAKNGGTYYVNEIIVDDGNVRIRRRRKSVNRKKYKVIQKEKEIVFNSNNENSGNRINNIITDGNNKMEIKNYLKNDEIKKLESILNYTEDELNDLSYDLALKNDKRTYWQFYFSLIKTKHEFIYAFLFNKDYNSKIIKIDLFVFGFGLNYAINGLFFNDDTMHNVYENKGCLYHFFIILIKNAIHIFLFYFINIIF